MVTVNNLCDKPYILSRFKSIPPSYFKNKSVNLHIHSECSDGRLEVSQIYEQAKNKGVKVIAISDHDTLLHLNEEELYSDFARKNGIEVIRAVELSTRDHGALIHLLIYGANPKDSMLYNDCKYAKYFAKFRGDIKTTDAVKRYSEDYVVVLAHPLVYKKIGIAHFIKKLKKLGLAGVEAYYPYEALDQMIVKTPFTSKTFFSKLAMLRSKFVNIPKIAAKNGLLVTGGLDVHGPNIEKSVGF